MTQGATQGRDSVRAVQALALLLGFYVAECGVVLAFAVLGFIAAKLIHSLGIAGMVAFLIAAQATLLAFVTMIRSVTVSTRFSAADGSGVPVTPEEEPELWERVRRLAQTMGTRAPQQILIGPEADAAVWECGPLLGLIPGKRYLIIGAPLLLALTTEQLDAVLAHELAHFGNSDTRFGPVVNRGRLGILTAIRVADRRVPIGQRGVRAFEPYGWWYVTLALRGYAHLFFSLTQATSRAQEFAADQAGARVAGRENFTSALAELPVIAAAYRLYLERYVFHGLPYGVMPEPAQVIGGFGCLIAEPGRRAASAALPPDHAASGTRRFDSHPPLGERLAALRALPDDGRTPDEPSVRLAVDVLCHQQDVLTEVGRRRLGNAAAGKTSLDWPSLTDAVVFHTMDGLAAPLVDAVATVTGIAAPTPASLLDAIDACRLADIRNALKKPPTGAGVELSRRLRAWVLVVLAERGQVRWNHSWSGSAELAAPPGLSEALDSALADALADEPDGGPLRAILHGNAFR